MARKALLRGNAGNYRIRGTIWDLGSFAYRAYVHLVPAVSCRSIRVGRLGRRHDVARSTRCGEGASKVYSRHARRKA